jgi:hypothetical protein
MNTHGPAHGPPSPPPSQEDAVGRLTMVAGLLSLGLSESGRLLRPSAPRVDVAPPPGLAMAGFLARPCSASSAGAVLRGRARGGGGDAS